MYIAILTDSKLIARKEEYEKKLESLDQEKMAEQFDETEKLYTESPLSVMKKALEAYDNQVEFLSPDENLYNLLHMGKFDLIVNTAGKLATNFQPAQYIGMLDITKIPFSGSKMTTIGLCKDKALFKQLLRLNYIATTPFQKMKISKENIPPIKSILKFPIVVKFFTEGIHEANISDSIAEDKQELQEILENIAKKYDFSYVLLEEYVPGKKYYLPVIGNDLNDNIRFLPMMEYDYPSAQSPKEIIGAKLPPAKVKFLEMTNPLVKRARDVAKKAFTFYNCRDYAMVVFLQDERNENLLLHEINPLTSLLPTGKILQAADHIGDTYAEILNEILLYTMIRYKMKIRGKYNKKFKEISKE